MKHLIPLLLVCGCHDNTGEQLVSFKAFAAGPSDAQNPLLFTTSVGYDVTLTRAVLHIGVLYLDQNVSTAGTQETGCLQDGGYVAQVLGDVDVDALSSEPQPFSVDGIGISRAAKAAELWLTGGDVNLEQDTTVIVDLVGTASKGGQRYAFTASITIGKSWKLPVSSAAFPGSNPICKQRIVAPVPVDFTLANRGTLVVHVDPRAWVSTVDFSKLPADPASPGAFAFVDALGTDPSDSLFQGFHTRGGYRLEWQAPQ